MGTPETGSRGPGRPELSRRSRRWFYAIAAVWLTLAALAVAEWLLAESSEGRWLAGVQCVIGLGLGIAYLVQASSGRRW
jgi:hypothetical protein